MTAVGRLYNDGTLNIAGEVNERLPCITNGLVSHFSFDGVGGTFDSIGGAQLVENTLRFSNLVELMSLDWKDPNSWSDPAGISWSESMNALKFTGGTRNSTLKIPLLVDVNKHYFITASIYQESSSSTNVLYLGGHGVTATGATYTANEDYDICTTYTVPLGQWIKVGTNRYGSVNSGNGWQGSQGSIVTGPLGWTSSNGLCVNYHFGGLFNYNCQNATDVMYIKDISIEIIDNNNSTSKITDDGIYVEEGTTNLINPDNLSIYINSDVRLVKSITALQEETYKGNTIYRVKLSLDTDYIKNRGAGANGFFIGNLIPYYANKSYTASVFYRPISHSDITLNGTPSNIAGWQSEVDTIIEDGWHKYNILNLSNVDRNDYKYYGMNVVPSSKTGDVLIFDISCNQIEQKTYSTSFVNGTRLTSSLGVQIPLIIKQYPFSVTMNVIPDIKNGVNAINGSESQLMYIAGLWGFLSGSYAGQIHQQARSSLIGGLEKGFRYTLLYKNETQWDAYINNTLAISNGGFYQGSVALTLPYFTLGCRGSEPSLGFSNAMYKDVSFYNRVLSTNEISKLCNPNFSINKNGNINNSEIKEGINSTPTDIDLFSLDFECIDSLHCIVPTTETDTTYKNNSIFIGGPVTNMFIFPTEEAGPQSFPVTHNTCLYTTLLYHKNSIVYKYDFLQNSGSIWAYRGTQVAIVVGETYTYSMDVYMSTDTNTPSTNKWFIASTEQGLSSAFYYDNTKKGTWQSMSVSIVATTTSAAVFMYPMGGTCNVTTGYILYKDIQLEHSSYKTPWVNGTRGSSKCYLPIVKAQNTDFTLNIFTKPVVSNGTSDIFCDDSDRWNGQLRTTGDNRVEFLARTDARAAGQNLYAAIKGASDGRWHMYTLVSKSGYGSYCYQDGILIANWPGTYPQYTSVSIGRNGMGDASVFPTYLKDFFHANRSLSQIEIMNIYKTNMKSINKNLQINNSIIENSILI